MSKEGSLINLQSNQIPIYSNSKIIQSSFYKFYNKASYSPISIKLVLEGEEVYEVDKVRYRLRKDNYLIVNQGESFNINIDSSQPTKGLCFYPPIDLINEIFSSYFLKSNEDILNPDITNQNSFFTNPKFHINRTVLGNYLKSHLNRIVNNKNVDYLDFYIGFAEALVKDQLIIENQMKRLTSLKRKTREELYRRLTVAREYIHDNQNGKLDLEQLSNASHLSKYHFIRCFKTIFNQSPYQYLLSLKLNKAKQLSEKGYSYSEISDMIGFSDVKNLKKKLIKKDIN